MTALQDYSAAVTQPMLTGDATRFDEVVAPDGSLRTAWKGLAETAVQLTESDLGRVSGDIERMLADDGVTYTPPEQASGPWRLDPIPLVIDAADWTPLEVGLAQRTELLNAILVRTRLWPPRLPAGFRSRLGSGIEPPFARRGRFGPQRCRGVAGHRRPRSSTFRYRLRHGEPQSHLTRHA